MQKIKKPRKLSEEERTMSRLLPRAERKIFYQQLMNGIPFESLAPWCQHILKERGHEIDILEQIWEALVVCEGDKLPPLDMLEQALQVSTEEDTETWVRQVDLILPLFYVPKEKNYAKKFKSISYRFIDTSLTKKERINANLIDFIFFGDYFSSASAAILAKHAHILTRLGMGCYIHMKLGNMLNLLASREQIDTEASEDVAKQIFARSLNRNLHKEEISIMILFALRQVYQHTSKLYAEQNAPDVPVVFSNYRQTEKALAYCETNGFSDLEMWKNALCLTNNDAIWHRQVAMISRFLLNLDLSVHPDLKKITYHFIDDSFALGKTSSALLDFVFDGNTFSSASTVLLARHFSVLKEKNISSFINQHLEGMMFKLMYLEGLDFQDTNRLILFLFEKSLKYDLNKEEISLLNLYTLQQIFNL